MYHKNFPEFPDSFDIFWLSEYFELKKYHKFSKYNS